METREEDLPIREYAGGGELQGAVLVVEGVGDAAYNELVEIITPSGETRLGQVLASSRDQALVEIFGGGDGLNPGELRVRFRGHPLRAPVAREMLGRTFDGIGRPRDGLPPAVGEARRNVNGAPLNPAARAYPRSFIETGISAIDGMNTLVRGQKLPIFSGNGLPHDALAAQIAQQARIAEAEEQFAIVFAAMGVNYDTAQSFQDSLSRSGTAHQAALFLNLADDPPIERIITPRVALTLAEFLAFDREMHVLVLLTDITNYAEALRELSSQRDEVPTRKGYPGYLYSDLARLMERCGRVAGREGSVTLMPIVTMPNDDITHPIPDLTGYITEGQIVLGRELNRKGVYPPINVLDSLSRLMKDGIGEDTTRGDHPDLSNQLYAAYTEVQDARDLADIIGEEDLPARDRRYLRFGKAFEERFLSQRRDERRDVEQTLDRGWEVLRLLPEEELTRVTEEQIAEHYPDQREAEGG